MLSIEKNSLCSDTASCDFVSKQYKSTLSSSHAYTMYICIWYIVII